MTVLKGWILISGRPIISADPDLVRNLRKRILYL